MGWSFQGPVRFGLLVFLIAFSSTVARECKINCHGPSGNVLKFEPGKVYNYALQGQSVTTLGGASGDISRLGISADVQVSVLSSCEHALKVTNVQTYGTDNKKHNLDKLSIHPIKFGLQNGRIESELCATSSEDNVGLDIKRAVLSLIQSSILKDSGYGTYTETDVFGVCPTGFEFSKSGGTITVIKTRNLNKCAHREDITLPFLSTPYYVKSDIQSSSLLSSSFRSEQKIEGGILKSASVEEKYEYAPGAIEAEAKVVVKTNLNFVNSAPGAIPASCNEPRSIIFEQEHPQEAHGVSNRIVDLVRQGCENKIVEDDTAQKFSELVKLVARASKQDISNAIQHVKSGPGIKERPFAQRMLLDAIVLAQSASSVEIMADILKKKEVTGTTARLWLLGLGAVKHASRSSLSSVLPLLDGEPDVNAYLGIGSLAGKYCREHSCEGVNEVNQLQIKLGAPLLQGCRVNSRKEEDHIIASLKGLGNIKYLGPKISGKIIECIQDEKVPPRIRVAGLETIASDPNKEQFKNLALNILKNVDEDAEIRIKAYQVVAKCPCGKVAGAVKDLLNTEQSNQVGGYIVSHLRSLHASTNPDKAAARHYLGNIIPPRRFTIDPRRYSLNQELSYSADIINTGASGEVDVIYSQNSFVPRSLSLNLTTQLFGTAYNLLEVDARAENLDLLAEKILGPRGYVKANEPEDLYEDARNAASSVLERIASRYDKSFRPKRSISRGQLDSLANKVHLPPVSSNEPELDLSVKVLGSEVSWTHLHGSESINPEKAIDAYFGTVDSFVQGLKNADVDYRRHITFVDREVTYPTGMGLGMQMNLLGSGVFRLKTDGKLDLPAIAKDPKNTNIRFQVIPSAAININAELKMSGVNFDSTVRVKMDIHSSTGADLTLRVLNGRGVDVKLGLPLPQQEIISVKTNVETSLNYDDSKSPTVKTVKYKNPGEPYSGCFDQLAPVLGLTFCGDFSMPQGNKTDKLVIPPINFSAKIKKEDDSLSGYHFKAYYDHREDSHVHSVEILFDTPNTKVSRRMSLNLEGSIKHPKRYFKVNAESPLIEPISLEATLVDTNNEHSINAVMKAQGEEYLGRVGAKASGSGSKVKYEPIFEYKAPEPAKGGLIGKKGGQKPKQALTATGFVVVESSPELERYVFQGLGVATPRTTYSLDGTVVVQPQSVNGDLKVSYDKENVGIKGKAKYSANDIHGNLEVSPSQYPDVGVSITLDSTYNKPSPGDYDSKLVIVHGPDPKSDVSRITILNKLVRGSGAMQIHHEIKYPVVQLDASIKGDIKSNSFLGGVRGKLDKYSTKLEVALERDGKSKGDYKVSLGGELMGNEIQFLSSRDVEGESKSRFTNLLILKPGGSYSANAVVIHKLVSLEDFHLEVDADASIPNKDAIKFVGSVQRKGPQTRGKLKANIGSKLLIDGASSLTSQPTPNGQFHLDVPGYINMKGKIASDTSNWNTIANLHLPKADRKMEAKADFVTKLPKYSGTISLCYDTSDPSKTLKIQTDNEIVSNKDLYSLDSRNTLSFEDVSLQVNGKGKSTGGLLYGAGSGEVEVVLPNGYHIGSKYSRNIKNEGKEKEAEIILELYDQPKGQQPQKLKISGVGKHIDLQAGTIDGQGSLNYVSRSGQDANVQVNFKKMPKSGGKTSNINGEVRLHGSLIEHPSSFKLESEVSNEYFELDDSMSVETDLPLILYKVSGNLGEEIKFEGNGKLNGPTVSVQLSGQLPEKSGIKNFKIISNNNLDIKTDSSDEHAKIKFDNAVHWNDNRHVAVLVEGELEENGIEYALQYETDSTPKRRLSGSAHYSTKDSYKGDASVNVNYDGKSTDLSVKGELNKEKTDSTLHILLNAPQLIAEEKVDILMKNKVVKEGRGFHTDIAVSSKSGKATAVGKVELDPEHPLLEINYDHPNGKSRLYYKGDKKGERHWTADVKAKWTVNGGGSFSADSDVNLESIDNFSVKTNVEGSVVENKKIHVEVVNRPAKGEAKKITILAKSDDKVLLSGSSNYNYKDEGDVAVLEGSGSVKYKDQTYPLTFQATRQRLENGLTNKLNVKGGKMSLNVEHRFTPDEFFMQRVFCKEPKTCSKAQISSKIKTGPDGEEQNVVVQIDLPLFYSFFVTDSSIQDFIYKSSYKRENLEVDHNVELQWAQNSKIKSHSFIHENAAGMYITLPQRTIGGEIKYDVKKKGNGATLKLETDLYINKDKEPKLCFIAGTTTFYDKGVATIAGEVKVTHPSLGKDLAAKAQVQMSDKPSKLIDGALEIDVSPNAENKIIGKLKVTGSKDNLNTLATLKSKGCNIDLQYEEKIKVVLNGKDSTYAYSESFSYVDSKHVKHELLGKFEASAKSVLAVVKLPELVFEGEYRLDKGYTGTHYVFGRKYADNLIINKDTNSVKYQLTGLEGGKTLSLEAGAKLGGTGVVRAALNNKNACSLDVSLDENNFLKSQYNYDTDVMKSIYAALSNEVSVLFRDCSKSIQTLVDRQLNEGRRLLECISKAKPNLSGVEKYVEGQLKQIKEEIEKDKSVQEAIQVIKEVTGAFGEQFVDILKELVKFAKTLNELGEEALKTLETSLKELQPKVQASLQRLSKVFGDLLEQYLKLSVELVDLVLDKIKAHEKDIKAVATTIVEFAQDIGQVIGQTIITIDKQMEELFKNLLEQFKELPVVAVIQEKLEDLKDFKVPEEVLNLLHELAEQLKQLLPTNEATKFVSSASSVLEKILKREEIKNKDEVFKELYKEFVAAIKSLIALVAQNAPKTGLMKPASVKSIPLVNFLRGVGTGGVRVSVVNLLTSKDFLPSVEEFTSGLKVYLDPLSNIPPFKGHGYILGGTEIITFDGVHLGVPASCSYILAEDYRDRNFSVVGQITNGALKSLTVSSRKDSVEITAAGNALVNGKETALPAIAGELKVWRNTYSLGIWSDSGLLVICSPELDSCGIEVNGFYFGKLRGLLGNLNGEKYDERLTPEGKIVQTTSELASKWKLDGSCGSQSPVGHKHSRDQECTRLFSDEPVVQMCRPFVDPAPYRDACDHLAGKSKTEGACLAAQAYVHHCREHGVFVAEVPDVCGTCKINGKSVKAGSTETVTQDKAADIVVVTELLKDNEFNYKQLATPLVAGIKSELTKAGVNDVRVFIVGGGSPKNSYPSFFTNVQGQCAHDPASSALWFDERPVEHNETIVDKIKTVYNYFKRESGNGHGNTMYKLALETPFVFRPNAHRLIIGVQGKRCPAPSPGVAAHTIVRLAEMEMQGVQFSVISPLSGVEKDHEEISVAAVSEKEALGEAGEPLEGADYLGTDLCVHAAMETGGYALDADVLHKSSNRNQLIQAAAAKIASSLTSKKLTFECDCSLYKGIIAQPDCYLWKHKKADKKRLYI